MKVGTCLLQTWRTREMMKTVSVTLVIFLKVGLDPPDLTKTQPTLCQIGVLGGLSHPQVGQIGDE